MKKKRILVFALIMLVVSSLILPFGLASAVSTSDEAIISGSSPYIAGEEAIEKDGYYEYTTLTGDRIEVGDKTTTDFKPTVKLNRWDGECYLEIGIDTTKKTAPTALGDRIYWESEEIGAEFYPQDDNFKFNIVLKERPLTNVFPLKFESDNLNFYYQPPLTEEFQAGWSDEFQDTITVTETDVRNSKGEVVVHRPENVVGSYAVYHATKQGHILGQTNYMAGKAFHWFRPLIWDAIGKKCWGELNVDVKAGIRTVTIPQSFLDNAVYPVTIDDDFGYKETTGSVRYMGGDDVYGVIGAGGAGTGVSISAYLKNSGDQFKGILVKQSDKTIVTNGVGAAQTIGADYAWLTSVFGVAPTIEAIAYYACVIGDAAIYGKYDITATGDGLSDTSNDFTSPTDPTDAFTPNYKLAIYCTYTLGGGGCSPDISNTPISKDYGVVAESSTYETGLDYYTVTNNSGGAVTITIQAIDFTGGNGWTLSDTATPGVDTAGLKAGLEGGDYTIIVKKTPAYNTLVSGLANEATQKWGLVSLMRQLRSGVSNYTHLHRFQMAFRNLQL